MSAVEQFTTRIEVRPGYDHRDDPSGNKGAHGLAFWFILTGPLGAITWSVNTGWMERPLEGAFTPGGAQRRRERPGPDARLWDYSPSAGAVSSHAHIKSQEWWMGPSKCDVLGGECYGDTGYTIGDEVLAAMFKDGHEGVWETLRGIYEEWLNS